MKPIRRVVTGLDDQGRSTIVMDSERGNSIPPGPDGQGPRLSELWETTEVPVTNRGNDDRARPVYELLPRPGGSLLRVFDILPEPEGTPRSGTGTDRHPGFHTTDTIDYIIVLEGEVYAVLEAAETRLRAGDVFIQRGTNHAWSNRSDAPCRMAAVMIDAEPLA